MINIHHERRASARRGGTTLARLLLPLAVILALPPQAQGDDLWATLGSDGPSTEGAGGWARADWDEASHTLKVTASFDGLTSPVCAVHLHEVPGAWGDCGTASNLFDFDHDGVYSGQFATSPGPGPGINETLLLRDSIYVDVHTDAGSLRGALKIPLHAGLGGGHPTGLIPLLDPLSLFLLKVSPQGPLDAELSYDVGCPQCPPGPALMSIHTADPTLGGAPVLTLASSTPAPEWSGVASVPAQFAAKYVTGGLWVNIGNAANPHLYSAPMEIGYLNQSVDQLTKTLGGRQYFILNGMEQSAGKLYLVLGSANGTSPGLPIGAGIVPLNPDLYFSHTLANPFHPIVQGLGVLDANGKTLEPFFKIPPGVMPPGVNHLDHAFVVIDPVAGSVDLISNTVGLDFVP